MVLGVFTTLLALVALQLREQRIALHLFFPGLAVKCSTLKQVLKYLCTLFLALDCPCTFVMDMQMPHRILIFNLCISKWCLTLFIKWLTSLKTPLNSQKTSMKTWGTITSNQDTERVFLPALEHTAWCSFIMPYNKLRISCIQPVSPWRIL